MRKIKWSNRYSGSDKPDELGRWARVGHLESKNTDTLNIIQIAWINKVNDIYVAHVYIGAGANFTGKYETLEGAKFHCEQIVNEFFDNY